MTTLPLLIVSSDAENTRVLTAVAEQSRFSVWTANTDEAAVEKNCQLNFDAVIAGKGLSDEAVRKLKAVFKASSPDTTVIVQEEKGAGDIRQQLRDLYVTKQKERLQHIAVNDTTNVRNLEGEITVR